MNKEKKAEYDRKYRDSNKEALKVRWEGYSKEHKEEKATYDRKYREINKESLKIKKRKY